MPSFYANSWFSLVLYGWLPRLPEPKPIAAPFHRATTLAFKRLMSLFLRFVQHIV